MSVAGSVVQSASGEPDRERFGSGLAFIITAIGSAIGLGSVWRFPAQNYEYGGGAYFIPYVLAFFFIGIPVLILEVGLGQHFQGGAAKVFGAIHGRLRLIGIACCFVGFAIASYYTPLIAWFVRMFILSFYSQGEGPNMNVLWVTQEYTFDDLGSYKWVKENILEDPTDPDKIGIFWPNTGCLVFTYLFIWCSLAFGIKVTGIVSYFAVVLPVIMIIVLLGAACRLDGAYFGVIAYIGKWDMTVLTEKPAVWGDAVGQIFFSSGVIYGMMPAFGSYNDPKTNLSRNSWIIGSFNAVFSVVAGFAVFCALGHLSYIKAEKLIEEAVGSDAYLTRTSTFQPADIKYAFHLVEGREKPAEFTFFTNLTATGSEPYGFDRTNYTRWFDHFASCGDVYEPKQKDAKCTDVAMCKKSCNDAAECTYQESPSTGEFNCQAKPDTQLGVFHVIESFQPVGAGGFSLAFGTYPVVLSTLPGPNFWNALFFLTLFLLGIDSAFAILEAGITVLLDTKLCARVGRMTMVSAYCGVSFLAALPYMTNIGFPLLDVVDHYATQGLLLVGLFECIAAGWVYRYTETCAKCGVWPTRMLIVAVFFPVFLIGVIAIGITAPAASGDVGMSQGALAAAVALPVGLGLLAVLLGLTLHLQKTHGDTCYSYRERVWELFFGNLEHLRDVINAKFVPEYDIAKPWWGIPKYAWSVSLKYIACPVLLILNLVSIAAQDDKDTIIFGRYGKSAGYESVGLTIFLTAIVLVVGGIMINPRYLSFLEDVPIVVCDEHGHAERQNSLKDSTTEEDDDSDTGRSAAV
eukprot:GEMP01007240.1.p1 GENE.GEMP01007240.1~~GEMP01007240.1.p1  ORF type:complete len:801 (+),score=195.40 GEMP01007240.1:415-2817(+)